ncbi:MAG: hypothetical protein GY804_10575 [Alphaproteobacteria bacterium]|nr:hypothetical protein [Alphaproteobacteria bacterium]
MAEINKQNPAQAQANAIASQNAQLQQPSGADGGADSKKKNGAYSDVRRSKNAYVSEILSVLLGFSYSEVSLRSVSGVLQKHLGDNWRATVYDCLSSVDEEQYAAAVAKLDELFTYENALAAWGEAVGYSQHPQSMREVNIIERLEALEYWLKFFGEEGVNLFAKIRALYESMCNVGGGAADKNQYIEQAESVLSSAQQQEGEEQQAPISDVEGGCNNLKKLGHLDKQLLWEFNYFLELCSYYDRTMSRIAARCVQQGIKMEQYSHVSYAFDVLEEMVSVGRSILKNTESAEIIESVISGGVSGFEKMITHYAEEFSSVTGEDEELAADVLNVEDRDMFVNQLGFVDRASDDGKADASEEEKEVLDVIEEQEAKDAAKSSANADKKTSKQQKPKKKKK